MPRTLLLILLSACTGGVAPVGNQDPTADAPVAPPIDAAAPSPDAPSLCKPLVAAGLTDGHHNAGQDCQGGCHDHGFTLSGTLYTTPAGVAPKVGATITITDAMMKQVDAVSQQNGNFYTKDLLVFPVTVRASACPDHVDMTGAVPARGGCNQSGCHTPNIGQGVIHFP